MLKLDHLAIFVTDVVRSREWYTTIIGLKVEFEVPALKTVALQDDSDFTLLIGERPGQPISPSCVLTFQVDNVEEKYKELSGRGVAFRETPKKLAWGYGAELLDPVGYIVCLWDEKTMKEKG